MMVLWVRGLECGCGAGSIVNRVSGDKVESDAFGLEQLV